MLRIVVRAALLSMVPVMGLVTGAVLADVTTTGVPGVDQVPILAAGGTVGLITGMAIVIVLFLTGRVERGAVSAEWKAVAQESVQATSSLVPSVEKLTNITERLLRAIEDQNTEARLRREFEEVQSRRRTVPREPTTRT